MIINSKNDERHIVFITDDNYVIPTKVVITSLISNVSSQKGYKYVVHICTFGINEENKYLLENCSNDNVKVLIKVIDESFYADKFSKINQKSHVTPAALIKFDLCKLFPNIDELLYLDSDIIINKSLDSLYDFDITNYYLAASYELWEYLLALYKYKKTAVGKPEFYFNSGVMLFNLKKLREDKISDKFWDIKFTKFNDPNARKQCMDQDTLNAVCARNCVQLPIKYNCNCIFTDGYDINNINYIYGTNYANGKELIDDAVIIHYVGKTDKPWKYEDARCRDIWDSYYEKAGFSISELNRIIIKKDFRYYISRIKVSLSERGLLSTIKYILDKGKKGTW